MPGPINNNKSNQVDPYNNPDEGLNSDTSSNFDSGNGLDSSPTGSKDTGDSFGNKMQNVTRDQILQLFHKVEASHPADEKELLNTLRDALHEVQSGHKEQASQDYDQVAQTFQAEEPNPPKTDSSDKTSDTQGKDSADGSDKTKGKDPTKTEMDKTRSSVADTLRGSVGKVGINRQDFVDLDAAHGAIKHQNTTRLSEEITVTATGKYAVGWKSTGIVITRLSWGQLAALNENPNLYNDTFNGEAEGVKRILGLMADAIAEKDPSKREKLWQLASDSMSQSMKGESARTSDESQLMFNVLYGELGEEGLKKALQSGLIPADFAKNLASNLEANSAATDDLQNEISDYQTGGGLTHGQSADLLKKNSADSPDSGNSGDSSNSDKNSSDKPSN